MFHTNSVEKIKSYILRSILFFYLAFYEILWKNTVEPGTPQMTIWRMRNACWIPKATDMDSDMKDLLIFHCKNVDSYDENHCSLLISVELIHT